MQLPEPVANILLVPLDIYEAHPHETREALVAAAAVLVLLVLLL